jgi:hypothetical protein
LNWQLFCEFNFLLISWWIKETQLCLAWWNFFLCLSLSFVTTYHYYFACNFHICTTLYFTHCFPVFGRNCRSSDREWHCCSEYSLQGWFWCQATCFASSYYYFGCSCCSSVLHRRSPDYTGCMVSYFCLESYLCASKAWREIQV